MKVLLVGDIVGNPGRTAMARVATRWKAEGKVDAVVANAENAAAGRGITGALAEELLAGGADVLTMGDHVWDQKESLAYYDRAERVVRGLNLPPGCPGRGETTVEVPGGTLTVVQLIGRTFLNVTADCPFRCIDAWLKRCGGCGPGRAVVVDFHAEATSEKIAMAHFLDGRVSALAGTHTHVQTADEAVWKGGMAYLTDLGMTGPCDGVIGRVAEPIVRRFMTGLPAKFDVASGDVRLHGACVTVDMKTGRATAIRRVEERSPRPAAEDAR